MIQTIVQFIVYYFIYHVKRGKIMVTKRKVIDGSIIVIEKDYNRYTVKDYINDFALTVDYLNLLPFVIYKIDKVYKDYTERGIDKYIYRGSTTAIDTASLFFQSGIIDGNYMRLERWGYIKKFLEDVIKENNIDNKVNISEDIGLCDMISMIAYEKSGGKYGE